MLASKASDAWHRVHAKWCPKRIPKYGGAAGCWEEHCRHGLDLVGGGSCQQTMQRRLNDCALRWSWARLAARASGACSPAGPARWPNHCEPRLLMGKTGTISGDCRVAFQCEGWLAGGIRCGGQRTGAWVQIILGMFRSPRGVSLFAPSNQENTEVRAP